MISIIGELSLPDPLSLDLPTPLQRYAEIRREHAQLLNLLAVVEGLKPCLDDWIPAPAYGAFCDLCRDLGLVVRAGIQFDQLSHYEAERMIGSNTLTTTRARATPIGADRGSVHVFVGRDADAVDATYRAGWYPLVVGDRASSKPWIDHIWFGEGLGYPDCCLRAFASSNNWAINNMPFQAARAAVRPSYLCNSIMRFTGLTWAAHLPCSYDCAATIAQSTALRDLTVRQAPRLAELVDNLTAGWFLLLSEWEAVALHRVRAEGPTTRYEAASLVPSNRPNLELFEAIVAGDSVEIRDDLVLVRAGDDVVHVEQCRTDGFAPRVPVLVHFDGAQA